MLRLLLGGWVHLLLVWLGRWTTALVIILRLILLLLLLVGLGRSARSAAAVRVVVHHVWGRASAMHLLRGACLVIRWRATETTVRLPLELLLRRWSTGALLLRVTTRLLVLTSTVKLVLPTLVLIGLLILLLLVILVVVWIHLSIQTF